MTNQEYTPFGDYTLPDMRYNEEDLLGCLIKWPDVAIPRLQQAYPDLVGLHFGEPRDRLFNRILTLYKTHGARGVKPTLLETAELSADYIGSLALRLGDDEDVLLYAEKVFDVAKRREFRRHLSDLYRASADSTYDECVALAERRIFPPVTPLHSAPVQSLGDLAFSYWEAVAERKNSAPTGFAELDKRIGGGLQPARLYVLLGGTGSGKTTLANHIAEHIASAHRPVFYVTSEDAPSALLAKTLARLGNVDYSAVLYGYQTAKLEIDAALDMLAERQSVHYLAYLHDTGALSLAQMQEQTRAHFDQHAEGGPGVLVIDYLQRMARMHPGQGGQDTRDLVTRYTMALRAVAEALGCSVLALSSMNRASYNGKGDALASAKESGDIEYTADVILALAEDEKSQAAPGHKAMTLQLAKNRLGPANEYIKLDWQGGRQTFAGVA